MATESEWAQRFMRVAEEVASWSKDPNTKVGAVVVTNEGKIVATGYNGFPRRVLDKPLRYADQETKYGFVVHAELNAILNATQSVRGCALFVTLSPCRECAKAIIQSGIELVVYRELRKDAFTEVMFYEAGVLMLDVKEVV